MYLKGYSEQKTALTDSKAALFIFVILLHSSVRNEHILLEMYTLFILNLKCRYGIWDHKHFTLYLVYNTGRYQFPGFNNTPSNCQKISFAYVLHFFTEIEAQYRSLLTQGQHCQGCFAVSHTKSSAISYFHKQPGKETVRCSS